MLIERPYPSLTAIRAVDTAILSSAHSLSPKFDVTQLGIWSKHAMDESAIETEDIRVVVVVDIDAIEFLCSRAGWPGPVRLGHALQYAQLFS